MKKTLYHFSDQPELLKMKDYQGDFLEHFEVIPHGQLSVEEVMKRKFDFIELQAGDYESFKPYIKAVGWKINHLNVADILVREGTFYRPLNLLADCILQTIQQRMSSMSTSTSAMVIGDFDFVVSVTAKLALAGFSHFIISLYDDTSFAILEKRLKEFIFNLDIKYVKLNEITQTQDTSLLLISNLSEKKNLEAYESLTYFNFLSHGAVFVDAHSGSNAALIEEARRAELNVIEEWEILALKYKSLVELSKNSP